MIYSDKLIEFVNKFSFLYKYLHEIYNISFIIIGLIIVYISFKLVYEKIKLDNNDYKIPLWTKITMYILLLVSSIAFVSERAIEQSLDTSFYNSISVFESRTQYIYNKTGDMEEIKTESDLFKEQMDKFIYTINNTNFKKKSSLYTSKIDISIVRMYSLDQK